MSQVFISYAHVNPDQDIAAKLQRVIETNGFDVFVDSKIRLGQNWVEQAEVQLRNSTHCLSLGGLKPSPSGDSFSKRAAYNAEG
jgi:hypothetical protein